MTGPGMPGWPALLRVARREVWRHRRRSALVVVLIAVPVAVVACGLVTEATSRASGAELRSQELGRADLVLGGPDGDAAPDALTDDALTDGPGPARPGVEDALRSALPAGSDVVPVGEARLDVVTEDRASGGRVVATDAGARIHDGRFRVEEGRLPRRAGEVTLSPVLADELGASLGDRVALMPGPGRFEVVGVVRATGALDEATVLAPPDTVAGTEWWVDLPSGVDADRVGDSLRRAPEVAGVPIRTADAVLDASGLAAPPTQEGVWYVIGALCLAWTGVVAAATFAIGARRRLREVGLLTCIGGTERQARRLLVADGLVLGLVGSAIGVATGMALATPVLDHLDRYATRSRGPLTVPGPSLLGAAALGTAAAVLAARWPAGRAARLPTTAALDGRIGRPPRRARATVAGGLTMGLGAALLLAGAAADAEAPIAAGTALVVAGVAMLHRLLIDLVAHLARRAPLALRFAARDASRQASRTGPAVVASMLALAAAVGATTIGATATDRIAASPQERGLYPPGRFEVWIDDGTQDGTTALPPEAALVPERDGAAVAEAVVEAVDARGAGLTWAATAPTPGPDDAALPGPTRPEPAMPDRPTVHVATPEALTVLGVTDERTLAAYRAGAALRVDRGAVPSSVTITDATGHDHRLATVDATTGTLGVLGPVAIAPDTADRLGLTRTGTVSVIVDLGRPVAATDAARAHAAALQATSGTYTVGASTDAQACCDDRNLTLGALGLGLGIALPVLGLVAALTRNEAGHELAVLDAIGIGPNRRRPFAAAGTGLLAAYASTLALPAGLIPAVLYLRADGTSLPGGSAITLPWPAIATVLVGVPLTLAAVAWATAGRPRTTLRPRH